MMISNSGVPAPEDVGTKLLDPNERGLLSLKTFKSVMSVIPKERDACISFSTPNQSSGPGSSLQLGMETALKPFVNVF